MTDRLLTIAIPTYNDYRGLSMTVQSLGLHHGTDNEVLVFDNYGCEATKKFAENNVDKYIVDTSRAGTCFSKSNAVWESSGKWVLLIDSHVTLGPGAIEKLKQHLRKLPDDSKDIFHGVLLDGKGRVAATEMEPVWENRILGKWKDRTNGKLEDLSAEPVEIWGHGCGLMCVRKAAWAGYHPRTSGFGGEEGAIHEHCRAKGGKVILLPFLRWAHSFNDSLPSVHNIKIEEQLRNYLLNLGGLPDSQKLWCGCILHFSRYMGFNAIRDICRECLPMGVEIKNSLEMVMG